MKYWRRFAEPVKQFGYYMPQQKPAQEEARKPITKEISELLSAAVADDSLQQLKRIANLLEEQRADGKTRSTTATAFGGTSLQTLTSFTVDQGVQSYTTSGKNLIQIDYVSGEYSGIPANVPVYVPRKKLFSLQVVNGAGDIKVSINEDEGDNQAIIPISANSSFTHGMFAFPTIHRVSVINVDAAKTDSSVQLIWVT